MKINMITVILNKKNNFFLKIKKIQLFNKIVQR
jgi:hypothetical protein